MNGYKGEIKIKLYDLNYTMVVNLGSIAEFQSETGVDFMTVSAKALNAYYKSRSNESFLERAQMMTEAVSMYHAAMMFYVCAKKSNPSVEFEEFQEACLLEGIMESNDFTRSYALKFVQLCEFATLGIIDKLKKKKSVKSIKKPSKPSAKKKLKPNQ